MSEGSPRKEFEEKMISDAERADNELQPDSEEDGPDEEEEGAEEEGAKEKEDGADEEEDTEEDDPVRGYKFKTASQTTEYSTGNEDEEDTAASFPMMEPQSPLSQSAEAKRKRYLDGEDSDCDPDWLPWEDEEKNNKDKKKRRNKK